MIDKIWFGKNKLYLLLLPLSLVYGGIVLLRRKLYQIGLLKSYLVSVPVVVVGNLSVGGNGKTPTVIFLVEKLIQRGFRVGVISRGYGGKSANYPLVINQETTTAEAGDEPVLIFQRTKVPVAVSPKRIDAANALLSQYALDIIITDDGLQHYQLQRNVEIVVIDGKRWFGNGWWLPAGPMRERENRLKSADIVIVNGDSQHHLDNAFTMHLKPDLAVNILTGEKRELTQLQHVQAMAGIGYPPRFFTMLSQLGVSVENCHAFADHQAYQFEQLNCLASSTQTLLMTEKDAVKCSRFAQANWWYLPIQADLSENIIEILCNKIN